MGAPQDIFDGWGSYPPYLQVSRPDAIPAGAGRPTTRIYDSYSMHSPIFMALEWYWHGGVVACRCGMFNGCLLTLWRRDAGVPGVPGRLQGCAAQLPDVAGTLTLRPMVHVMSQ